MRLGQTNISQINKIKRRFDELNVKHNDVLDFEELCIGGYIVQGKLDRRFTAVERPIISISSQSPQQVAGPSIAEQESASTNTSTTPTATFENVEDAVRLLRERGSIPVAPKVYEDDNDDEEESASDGYTTDNSGAEREPKSRARTSSLASIDLGPRRYRKKRAVSSPAPFVPLENPRSAEIPVSPPQPAEPRSAELELVDVDVARRLTFEAASK
jgi:hypothetical protein